MSTGCSAGEDYSIGTMIELPRAACAPTRSPTRGLLLLRHQRPDAERARPLARRHEGRFLARYIERRSSTARRSTRSTRRASAQLVRMARGWAARQAGPQARRLRRARRRPGLIDFFHHSRHRLRVVLAVPRAGRPAGGGAGGDPRCRPDRDEADREGLRGPRPQARREARITRRGRRPGQSPTVKLPVLTVGTVAIGGRGDVVAVVPRRGRGALRAASDESGRWRRSSRSPTCTA